MAMRKLHVVHLLIRSLQNGKVCFLVYPHDKWLNPDGQPYIALPTKKTVTNPLATFIQGTSLEEFVDAILQEDLNLDEDDYALEQELEPAHVEMLSPTKGELTDYTIYPVDVWVAPVQREPLRERLNGLWLTCEEAINHPQISPTARAVFELIQEAYQLLEDVPEKPTVDALANKWFSKNKKGVRHLPKETLDRILDVGERAFNLRVADPYLRYQMQGLGFTWSFFTHKDKQDIHVHGAPVVEIYGVFEGELEIWWKPYYDRGTSAWNHLVLGQGDWLEVDSLQCHIVHWLTEGKGVVFKAGPGPLAEVGRLGVKGKTPCKNCSWNLACKKPQEVVELENIYKK
jgi:hypothetical protein